MAEYENQHFVPQYYLRRFSPDKNKKRVHTYDKILRRSLGLAGISSDKSLLAEVDRVTRQFSMTHADFARSALEFMLWNQKTIAPEQQHAQGYTRHPVKPSELDEWKSEQT